MYMIMLGRLRGQRFAVAARTAGAKSVHSKIEMIAEGISPLDLVTLL